MTKMLTPQAYRDLKNVHQLSRRYNGPSRSAHMKKLLSLLQEHADEISLLYKRRKAHYLVETGDLLVLCLEILLENKKNVDDVMALCFDRYERKLKHLIRERS